MAETADRKLYLGPRLRVLRRELGINQTQMAEELGVSPSYLNHLERNQRPLTAQMLLRLANTYDIDIRDFVSGANEAAVTRLGEVLADPLVKDIGIPRIEILEVAENYPGVVEALQRLYRALNDMRRVPDLLQEIGGTGRVTSTPLDWLRDFTATNNNHFAELDAAAEAIGDALPTDPLDREAALRERLRESGVSVRVMPESVMGGALRHYDFHRRRLMLAERLPPSGRLFALAYQLASAALHDPTAAAMARADPPDEETRALLAIALANYAAAAIVLPYARVHAAAEELRYDPDRLMRRFGVSFEQLAHRFTTLGRPNARGVPFFMLKIDVAGTVSKRFAGESFPFARFGGGCPRWNLHRAFRETEETLTQVIETPDGNRFFTISRALPRSNEPGALSRAAIALGCELRHAGRIALADALGPEPLPIAVGPACHICERVACPDRALPPLTRALDLNRHARGAPWPFRAL